MDGFAHPSTKNSLASSSIKNCTAAPSSSTASSLVVLRKPTDRRRSTVVTSSMPSFPHAPKEIPTYLLGSPRKSSVIAKKKLRGSTRNSSVITHNKMSVGHSKQGSRSTARKSSTSHKTRTTSGFSASHKSTVASTVHNMSSIVIEPIQSEDTLQESTITTRMQSLNMLQHPHYCLGSFSPIFHLWHI